MIESSPSCKLEFYWLSLNEHPMENLQERQTEDKVNLDGDIHELYIIPFLNLPQICILPAYLLQWNGH